MRVLGYCIQCAGMWFVLDGKDCLYEAWAWEGQGDPPSTLHQHGYRFKLIAEPI